MADLVSTRRNLPVLEFILTILRERFPDLEIRRGSAIYNLVVLPAALMFQPFYDRLTVMVNNQSLLRFEDMLEHEVDLLLANFLITRQSSSTATGTVRVFFSAPQDIRIETSAVFSTGNGVSFRPSNPVNISSSQLALRTSEGLFFVDVPVTASLPGASGIVDPGTITQFTGVPQAVRVTNVAATAGGQDIEPNSAFVLRAQQTLATRTLTSAAAIRAVVLDNFSSVKSLEVVGFGDSDMERDIVQAVISDTPIFEARFIRKVNLPFLDPDTGGPVLPGSGGAVNYGVVIDTLDATGTRDEYFFHKLTVQTDGVEEQTVSVQVGDIVKILDPNDQDFGEIFRVKQVRFDTFSRDVDGNPDEAAVHGLVLDKVFSAQSTWTAGGAPDEINATPYAVYSKTRVDGFHLGGKVDVYLDSENVISETVVVNVLEANSIDAAISGTPVFSEVPITNASAVDSLGQPLFKDNRSFLLPFLGIQKIEVVDPTDETVVLRELDYQTDYRFLTFDPDLRFTEDEDSIIRIEGEIGNTVKITYLTNTDVSNVQAFLDDPTRRDVTKDISVRSVRPLNVDVTLSYSGSVSLADVQNLVTDYINSVVQNGSLTVNDIVSVLNVFGVDKVEFPVTLNAFTFSDAGEIISQSSNDSIFLGVRDIFRAVPELSITKIG